MALSAKKGKAAMAVAMQPGKALAMQAFMMYMSGKQLNIFTITMTFTNILNPLMQLLNVNKVIDVYQDQDHPIDLNLAKLTFLAMNVVALGVGLYKMSTMGLLPTTSADWEFDVPWKAVRESMGVGIGL